MPSDPIRTHVITVIRCYVYAANMCTLRGHDHGQAHIYTEWERIHDEAYMRIAYTYTAYTWDDITMNLIYALYKTVSRVKHMFTVRGRKHGEAHIRTVRERNHDATYAHCAKS